MSRNLALFDFDGTITTKDTFIEVIKFAKGTAAFYTGFVLTSPILASYKLKLIPNWRAKELFFGYYFKGTPTTEFKAIGKRFAAEKLPSLIRKSALARIKEHIANGDRVIIITASASDWIKPWTDALGIELISTEWASADGKITGRIEGKNCHGQEKVNRILEVLNPTDYPSVSVYGDTSGDREMLKLGTQQFYRFFGQ